MPYFRGVVGPAPSVMVSTPTGSEDRINPKEQYKEFYLGARTPSVAEVLCKKPAVFRLYHRVAEESDVLQSSLPLYIVNRTNRGQFRCVFGNS